VVPVTGLSRRDEAHRTAVEAAVKRYQLDAAIRLVPTDLCDVQLKRELWGILHRLGRWPDHVHLIVDYQLLCEHQLPALRDVCSCLPNLDRWASFTFLAGSFPKDLTHCTQGRNELARLEWQLWSSQVLNRAELPRTPSYGDYAIQHPLFEESPPHPPSASIRYTSEKCWIVMRGERYTNPDGPGAMQWPANAKRLWNSPEFCGDNFSPGDAYIAEKAQGYGDPKLRPGNAKTWLQAGLSHHLTLVVRQIANLFGA
jgi:hypothetical protein